MSVPFNPGAVLITAISNATMLEVTTAVNHNFADQTFVVLKIPIVDGLLPPAYVNNPSITYLIISGVISLVSPTKFTIDQETSNYTPFVNNQPAYAIPLTYICYANPTPTFQPAYRLITAISNATQASVTTSFAHNFFTGTIVRLLIPEATGMAPINQAIGTVTVTSPTSFTINIDTNGAGTFAIPTSSMSSDPRVDICALVVPIGEDNSILYAATRNVLN